MWSTSGMIQVSQSASSLWKEIYMRAPDVIPQTRWVVGDGRSVSILFDSLVADMPLANIH